jgi:hypothetical protein
MDIVYVIAAVSAVAQVSQVDITCIGHGARNIGRVTPAFLSRGATFFNIEIDLAEDLLDGI